LKRALKILVLGGPAVLLAWLVLSNIFEVRRTDRLLSTADGLTWGEGARAIRVSVREEEEGERLRFRIEMSAADGRVLEPREFEVNRDTWGAGFVRAAQADEDPELEIVAWGHHEEDRTSFFLDHRSGTVEELPFRVSRQDLKDLARAWHQAHHVDPVFLAILGALALGYYLLVAVAWAVFRAVRRRRDYSRPSTMNRSDRSRA
jgi:hypothetical protein